MGTPKMLGLAVIAAAAFSAFAGTSAASAEIHEYIGLCGLEELLLCAEPLVPPVEIKGTQEGTGKFTGGAFGTEECTSASLKGTVGEVDVSVLRIQNLALTLAGCTPCTSVTAATIAEAKVRHDPLSSLWSLTGSEGIKSAGCPFGAKCKFGGSEIKTLIEMGGGKAWINTNGTSLKLEEGSEFLCGKEEHWFAKFNLTAGGKAVFTTLLQFI